MYITHCKQDNGDYRDKNNDRWAVSIIMHPTRYTREHLTPYDTLADALEAWGLTYDPRPEPEPEK